MSKPIWSALFIIAIIWTPLFQAGAAASLTLTGDVVTDTDTGLEWLVMSQASNKSPVRIIAGDYGLAAQGWALATLPQIETLYRDAGWAGPIDGGWTSGNYTAANLIVQLFGHTYEVNSPYGQTYGIQAFVAPSELHPVSVYEAWIAIGITPTGDVGGADFPSFTLPPSIESPGFGNWLVRKSLKVNSPPQAVPIGNGTYEILSPFSVFGQVSDLDGDLVTFQWIEKGAVLASGNIQTVAGGIPVDMPETVLTYTSPGNHVLTLKISDGKNPDVTYTLNISVIDDIAPTLSPIPDKAILWPPNHKMVEVNIAANASDNSHEPVTLSATVSSNEADGGLGDGDIASDWTAPAIDQQTGMIKLKLRAERAGSGNGRVYNVHVTASDQSGNSSASDVIIVVPHDRSKP